MIGRDIIAAIATAAGRGGIGVVRVSGPSLCAMIAELPGGVLRPRVATRATFRDGQGRALDEGLALFFPAPHSYTGEDVLELQGHGNPVVLAQLLERCIELGARLARPGEFTERAYLNGRIDLAQAEGVADLIEASNITAARAAVRSLQGYFSQLIQELSKKIINLRMLVEATLDFPEEDVEFLHAARAGEQLQDLQVQLKRVLDATRQGSRLREGLRVVLVGEPNVGKSSLLNRLAGEEVAIVTEVAGTTRDTLREQIDLEGLPVHIIDTAGLREAEDPVERIGIERTWSEIAKADLLLWLGDAARADVHRADLLARFPEDLPRLRVINKIDLVGRQPGFEQMAGGEPCVWLSAKTGDGIDALKRALWQQAGWQSAEEGLFTARARHVEALQSAAHHLQQAAAQAAQLELYAEELRLAHEALGTITGEFTADDLLGEIFSRFCIGK